MATSTFIPSVWSETLLTELDREYIGVRNCNRDFEGEIKDKGSEVKILGLSNISIFDYTKNTDFNSTQSIIAEKDLTLKISRAKGFNFVLDDIDRVQSKPKLMQAAMRGAAMALANEADKFVYSLYEDSSVTNVIEVTSLEPEILLSYIIMARQMLLCNGVNSNMETSLEISPEVATFLFHAKIFTSTDNAPSMENGLLGKLFGFNVYVTNNIQLKSDHFQCYARTKRAIAFAEQLNEVEAYRPEMRFADAVKGLHLYGGRVVYPKELVILDIPS